MNKPNPCYFCSHEVYVDEGHGVAVKCSHCNASGPYASTVEEAIALWNSIADSSIPEEVINDLNLLYTILYNRPLMQEDYSNGLNSQVFADAAREICLYKELTNRAELRIIDALEEQARG